jgi:hypothetical protein
MQPNTTPSDNVVLLRGATLWLLMALVLAWCLVGLNFDLPLAKTIFPGKFHRLLQAHIDFLLMSALILGFYASRVALPSPVRWAMVIGAFTNSSLFLLMAMFPVLDATPPAQGLFPSVFRIYLFISLLLTSFGFGRAAVTVLRSTFKSKERLLPQIE